MRLVECNLGLQLCLWETINTQGGKKRAYKNHTFTRFQESQFDILAEGERPSEKVTVTVLSVDKVPKVWDTMATQAVTLKSSSLTGYICCWYTAVTSVKKHWILSHKHACGILVMNILYSTSAHVITKSKTFEVPD